MTIKGFVASIIYKNFPRLWLSLRIARRDRYFDPEFWFIPVLCDKSHGAIDIGTNMGEYSFFMARYAKNVVSFEPNPDLWPEIRRRVPSTVIEGVALSDHHGSAEFRYVADNTGVATIETNNQLGMVKDSSSIRTRTVPMKPLDSYDLQSVSFIKIDVEGHEEAVLKGAANTLKRCRPALLIETEDRHNPGAPSRLFSWLRDAGYFGFAVLGTELTRLEEPAAGTSDQYINNFLFLPKEREDLRAAIGRTAESLKAIFARHVTLHP
ncbi:FkbM family methyltransferase [Telmatospirillum siberiense]|uniref:FkbM family methyltransferase n=1 Tax=Telmatospirillum siberiense TaxID=382514 RepID=A0A2N3PVM9_9PROT|nr:FkbM family methyltransferase [Telmatospirillum siberiense]PKU24463.1 FkbM family methyltransferase [Telmatospirillum siberiense]